MDENLEMKFLIIKCLRSLAPGFLWLAASPGYQGHESFGEIPGWQAILSFERTRKAAKESLVKCEEGVYQMSVAVVDWGGWAIPDSQERSWEWGTGVGGTPGTHSDVACVAGLTSIGAKPCRQ